MLSELAISGDHDDSFCTLIRDKATVAEKLCLVRRLDMDVSIDAELLLNSMEHLKFNEIIAKE
jgi:hypothetical protein